MPRNQKQVTDGDSQFKGIAPRLDPASLPEGMASEARNMRFRNGVAETRKGMYKCPWINNITPEIDSKVRPFGEVHGVGVFRNPKNLEFVIIAADNKVYFTRQNNNPTEMNLPDGVSITGTVNFTQAFNKMVMWRGEDFAPLVMSNEDDGFEDLVDQWDSTLAYDAGDEVSFGPVASVASITQTGGVATVTTSAAHGYNTGADMTIAGSSDTEFNGRFSATVGNPPATALNGAIDDDTGTTSITVDSTAGYPESGTLTIESEEITYTAKTATQFSGGDRAVNLTTIAAHADDTVVTGVTDNKTFTYELVTATSGAAGTITVTNNRDYYQAMNPPATALDGELIVVADTQLDEELFAPAATALNGAIDDDPATTTIVVDSTAGYPDSGNILIDSENISYATKDGTSFSGGARAQDSTTIAAHSDDVSVAFVQPTTITVDHTTDYPDSGTILVDAEKISYTGTTTDTFTGVTRGASSTTPSAHTDNTTVEFVYVETITVVDTEGYPDSGTIVVGVEKIDYTGKGDTTFTGSTRGSSSTTIAAHADAAAVTSVVVATTAGDSPASQPTRWGDGTTAGSKLGNVMPNSTHGVFIANRLVAASRYNADPTVSTYGNHRQFVVVSDTLSVVKTYFNQIFRINFGTDSEIQDLLVYDENRLLIFSDKNVAMMTAFITTDVNATLGGSVSIQPVVQQYGVPGLGAAVAVGSDVYFYASRRGIVSLSQTEQSKVRGVDMPLSEPIQPLIDRQDPRHEDKIRLAWWDNKLYCAMGLDDASAGNNSILIFDFISQSWSSLDQGDAINPAEFFIATYNNAQRLFYVGTDGFINLIEENDSGDDIADLTQEDGLATTDFESYLLTRGYHTNDIDHRDFRAAAVNISTWNPNFTIKVKTDGANESQTLVSGRTKSRFNYYRPFDAEPFLAHNNNADHANPYREDYSVELDVDVDSILTESGDEISIEEANSVGGGQGIQIESAVGGFVLGDDGVVFNRFQETLEPFSLAPRMGRYTQLELSNTSGRIKINQVTLTNQQGDRTIGVKS